MSHGSINIQIVVLIKSLCASNEGKVLTHPFLLRKLGGGNQTEIRYLREFVGAHRQKAESNPNDPANIITESGVGYRFQ